MGEEPEKACVTCNKVAVERRLDKAHDKVPVVVEHAHAVKEHRPRDFLVQVGHFVTAGDADKDAYDGKSREHDDRRDKARRQQELVGAQAQYFIRIELFGHRHGAKFRTHGGANAASKHHRGKDGAEFHHHGLAHGHAHEHHRDHVAELVGKLPRHDGASRKRRRKHHGQARDAHALHLFHGRMEVRESAGDVLEQFPHELEVVQHGPQEPAYKPTERFRYAVQQSHLRPTSSSAWACRRGACPGPK